MNNLQYHVIDFRGKYLLCCRHDGKTIVLQQFNNLSAAKKAQEKHGKLQLNFDLYMLKRTNNVETK